LDQGMNALVKAYAKQRLIEPRLSGGFRAGEYRPASDSDLVDHGQLHSAVDLIGSVVAERNDLEALLAEGRLFLAQAKTSEAIRFAKAAVKESPLCAEAHNDLGACFFLIGSFEKAIDEFGAALKRRPAMSEALFNRGLCYQRLQLRDAARDEFGRALAAE